MNTNWRKMCGFAFQAQIGGDEFVVDNHLTPWIRRNDVVVFQGSRETLDELKALAEEVAAK